MPAVYEHRLTVAAGDVDGLGHVNNARYVLWMQDAAVAHSSAQGWDAERYRQNGAAWVVRSHHIDYLLPALENDEIIVFTWVADFRKVRSLRKYRIQRAAGGALLAAAETLWVYVDAEKGTPRRPPRDLVEAFEIVSMT